MVRTRANSSATSINNPVDEAPSNSAPPTFQNSTYIPPRVPVPAAATHHNNGDRPAYEDVRSPYYLSTVDHPGLALVTPIFTDQNFQPRTRDFKLSIGARNKTPFLDDTLPKPPPDDPLYSSWIHCNQMVQSWILHSVSSEIKSSIMYFDTAAEMLTELNNRFNQGNGPRIFELNESLTFLHQGDDSVLLLDPCPPLNKVFSMIVHQERQRTLGNRNVTPLAAAASSSTPSTPNHESNPVTNNFDDPTPNDNNIVDPKPATHTPDDPKPAINIPTDPTPTNIIPTASTPAAIIPPKTASNKHQSMSKTGRNIKKPLYLQDYICDKVAHTTNYPIVNYVSYHRFSNLFRNATLATQSLIEPKSYAEVSKYAVYAETDALERNHTWIVTSLPPNEHVIGNKWVYKIKYNPDGSVNRLKARLVAKGYTQQQGIDFFDTYAPVAKFNTLKLLFALASIKQWHLHHMDIDNAFLHGDLNEDCYMKLPQGYTPKGVIPPNVVCK
uniref:Reverse transcriptase Ty1/copia-type domain-containing protein n=1 Tax=Cannabis sativa TaxID=3483 RepID=A0A803Q8Z3_CANSA